MLNWIVRYAVVADLLDRENWTSGSLLDVGAGPHGISCVRPDLPFVGLDVEYPERAVPTMVAIQAPPGPLPFADAAFDTVVSLDTLEHMPADQRPGFIAELARVSAGRVVLACPERQAAPADQLIADLILDEGQAWPSWLSEHMEFGLPSDEEVGTLCHAVPGFTARPLPTVNSLLGLLAVIGDIHPGLAAAAQTEVTERTPEWEALFLAGRFGPAARTAWVLEREVPTSAIVSPGDERGTLPAALRCPACGGGPLAERLAATWTCTACGHAIRQDADTDAWVLGTTPSREEPPAPPSPPSVIDPVPELQARIARLEAQLEHAQNLRIVRWTASLRRAVYRVRTVGRGSG